MAEVILDELIIRFQDSVVELFYAGRAGSDRFHIAQVQSCELLRLDSSRGPTFNLTTEQRGGVSLTHLNFPPAQLLPLQQLVAEITAAIPR